MNGPIREYLWMLFTSHSGLYKLSIWSELFSDFSSWTVKDSHFNAMMLPLIVLLVSLSVVLSAPTLDPKLDKHWDLWKTWNSKLYHEDENRWRRMIWEKNLRKIELHNLEHSMGKHSYRLAMNHYGDLSLQEFQQVMRGYRKEAWRKTMGSMFMEPNFLNLPKAVDWRKMGYVTPIKDQGHCGSCWAFSATGALEGQHFRKTGKLVSLSEQNLIDCSRSEGNDGCHGGMIDAALQYVMDNQGLDSEDSYPYQGTDNHPCRYDIKNSATNETGFINIPSGDEVALMKAVAAVGPISVAIDARSDTFQFYESGIYYNEYCSSEELDHAVLVVGYGYEGEHEDGRKYWIVKNSWSVHWGQGGYIHMAKDMDNHCGIATEAIYPLV